MPPSQYIVIDKATRALLSSYYFEKYERAHKAANVMTNGIVSNLAWFETHCIGVTENLTRYPEAIRTRKPMEPREPRKPRKPRKADKKKEAANAFWEALKEDHRKNLEV